MAFQYYMERSIFPVTLALCMLGGKYGVGECEGGWGAASFPGSHLKPQDEDQR